MAEQKQSPNDLYPFAQALVWQLVGKKRLPWSEHRIEDEIHTLFLAGWQVWSDEGDVGLAKNRMISRRNNLIRDYKNEREHEPKSASDRLKMPAIGKDGNLWDEDQVRGWDNLSSRDRQCGDPAGEALVNDYLASLTDRQRRIVKLRMADFTNREIADELSIGLRTVERELSLIRKDYRDDDGS